MEELHLLKFDYIFKNNINNNISMSDTESEYEDEAEPSPSDILITENHQTEDSNVFLNEYQKIKKTNKTQPFLNKYERTRVLAERAQQITDGAVIFITHPETYKNAYDIAVQELSERKIPYIIKRPYNNGYEYWKLEDLL